MKADARNRRRFKCKFVDLAPESTRASLFHAGTYGLLRKTMQDGAGMVGQAGVIFGYHDLRGDGSWQTVAEIPFEQIESVTSSPLDRSKLSKLANARSLATAILFALGAFFTSLGQTPRYRNGLPLALFLAFAFGIVTYLVAIGVRMLSASWSNPMVEIRFLLRDGNTLTVAVLPGQEVEILTMLQAELNSKPRHGATSIGSRAMKQCTQCAGLYSEQAQSCPMCGYAGYVRTEVMSDMLSTPMRESNVGVIGAGERRLTPRVIHKQAESSTSKGSEEN